VAVGRLEGWITDVLGALRGAGLAELGDYGDADWRQDRVSEGQLAALGRMSWALRYFPSEEGRKALRWVLEAGTASGMRRGTASDLLGVCRALADASTEDRRAHRHWKCPVELPSPPVVAGKKGALVAAHGGGG
jgi:hypothetical protein